MKLTDLSAFYMIYYIACVGVLGGDNVTLMVSVVYPAAAIAVCLLLRKLLNKRGPRSLRKKS